MEVRLTQTETRLTYIFFSAQENEQTTQMDFIKLSQGSSPTWKSPVTPSDHTEGVALGTQTLHLFGSRTFSSMSFLSLSLARLRERAFKLSYFKPIASSSNDGRHSSHARPFSRTAFLRRPRTMLAKMRGGVRVFIHSLGVGLRADTR